MPALAVSRHQQSHHVWITLGPRDITLAEDCASLRQGNAVTTALGPANAAPANPEAAMRLHLMGARGEVAVYNYLKPIIWNGYLAGRAAIDGKVADFELHGRWPLSIDAKTRPEDWHDLMIQIDDDPTWVYLLVLGHAHPQYCLVGWVTGEEAKQPCYLKDPTGYRPAYFIRQDDPILRPPADLLERVRRRQFVGRDREGHFLHYCFCGEWGAHGIDAQWYCRDHHPEGTR